MERSTQSNLTPGWLHREPPKPSWLSTTGSCRKPTTLEWQQHTSSPFCVAVLTCILQQEPMINICTLINWGGPWQPCKPSVISGASAYSLCCKNNQKRKQYTDILLPSHHPLPNSTTYQSVQAKIWECCPVSWPQPRPSWPSLIKNSRCNTTFTQVTLLKWLLPL